MEEKGAPVKKILNGKKKLADKGCEGLRKVGKGWKDEG